MPCYLICSIAPALKLSQATNITLKPLFFKRYATFARLVDFPTPLTPMNVKTKGLPYYLLFKTYYIISGPSLLLRIFVKDSSKLYLTKYF